MFGFMAGVFFWPSLSHYCSTDIDDNKLIFFILLYFSLLLVKDKSTFRNYSAWVL